MKKAILYIHGKGGNAAEADRFRELCVGYDVFGADYKGNTPWETKSEILSEYEQLHAEYDEIFLVAVSIGAFFAMNALGGKRADKAFFVSPVVDMEKLISDMMIQSDVTERELEEKRKIATASGEILSWEYLRYVRENPVAWNTPTYILYAENDNLTSYETVSAFAEKSNAVLTVMQGGEHWFHTKEQTDFLDCWLKKFLPDSDKYAAQRR